MTKLPARWAWLRIGFPIIVAVLLVVSVRAYQLIPKYGPWGFDLQNLWAFHECGGWSDPYRVTGKQCHDLTGRDMLYPPLLYWSFVWLRLVTFAAARWIWAGVIGLVVVLSPFVWSAPTAPFSRVVKRAPLLVFGAALVTQFPAAFAIERGNNDVVVLLLLSIAVVLAARARHLEAGAIVGLSTALKLYPAFLGFVVLVGMVGAAIRGGRARWFDALRFVIGASITGLLSVGALYGETKDYVTDVLPRFAKHLPAVTVYSHSIPGTFGTLSFGISAGILLVWAFAAFRSFESAPELAYAGGLAASTYVAATSFDYNLITAYPLLVVLATRVAERSFRGSLASGALLLLGLVAIVGHRGWFQDVPDFHVGLQVAWLAAVALLEGANPGEPGRVDDRDGERHREGDEHRRNE